MSIHRKIAVVTDAARGIGDRIIRAMLHNTRQPLTIYMTNASLKTETYPVNFNDNQGTAAALEKSGSEIRYEQVDPTSLDSIRAFRHRLQIAHGASHGTKPLSILVNSPAQEFENAQNAAKYSYFGPKNMSRILLPIMKRDGGSRIVNVSVGGGGSGYWLWREDLADMFDLQKLSTELLDALVRKYVRDASREELIEQGWTKRVDVKGPQIHPYIIPRMALAAYTYVLARENPDILINASGGDSWKFPTHVYGGAITPTFLALGDLEGVSGRYWIAGKTVDWETAQYKTTESHKRLCWNKPSKLAARDLSPSELGAWKPRPEEPRFWNFKLGNLVSNS
ncbi:hypothetical protein TWF506_006360 [Arthrobotrys conoides]|uniref:Uncharacterized protein n=1 Tax=Arthrobotrys conoides TaxID=74498 RepID=A0AAN8RYQ2_9PEZI